MATPTPQTLLAKARQRASSGRNNAGYWLAVQLHANGYDPAAAETVMLQFAAQVGGRGRGGYPAREALATLRAEYRRPPRKPWGTSGTQGREDIQRARLRQAFGTVPAPEPPPPEESVAGFAQQYECTVPIADTPAEVYLAGRGIPPELARAAGCRYAPAWGGRWPAVVFPFVDETGEVVAAAGRALSGRGFLTYGPKSTGAFLTPGALEADPTGLTEAPIDALTLHLAGLPTVAIAGTGGLPTWLLRRLGRPASTTDAGYSRTVVVATDRDAAGEAAARRIRPMLTGARAMRLRPITKDWNDDLRRFGPESVQEHVEALAATLWLQRNPVVSEEPAGEADRAPTPPPWLPGVSVHQLAAAIRAALVDRPLPIQIKPGERIVDLDRYAQSEARTALHADAMVRRPALDRLADLGLNVEALVAGHGDAQTAGGRD